MRFTCSGKDEATELRITANGPITLCNIIILQDTNFCKDVNGCTAITANVAPRCYTIDNLSESHFNDGEELVSLSE